MPITNTDRVLEALPYTINTYGTGPGTVGNPVGNSQPIDLERFSPTPGSGFQANFYKDPVTGQYTIAFAGTNDGPDIVHPDRVLLTANLLASVGAGVWDAQFTDAIRFTAEAFRQIQREYIQAGRTPPPLDDMRDLVQVVGHSLGGSLSELTAQFYGLPGVNIDGPGVQALVGQADWQELKAEVGRALDGLQADYQLTSEMFGAYAYTVVGVTGTHLRGIEEQRTPSAEAALTSMGTATWGLVAGSAPGLLLSSVVAGVTGLNHPGASILRETEIAAGLNPDAPMPESPFTTLLVGSGMNLSAGEGPTMTNIRLNAELQLLQINVANGLSPTGLAIGETTRQGPFSILVFVEPATGHLVEVRVPVDEQGNTLGPPTRTAYVIDLQGKVGIVGTGGNVTFIVNGADGIAAVVTVEPNGTVRGQTAHGDPSQFNLTPEVAQGILGGRQSLQQVLEDHADLLDSIWGNSSQALEELPVSEQPDIGTPLPPGAPIAVITDAGTGIQTDAGLINGYGDLNYSASPPLQPDAPREATNGFLTLGELAGQLSPGQTQHLLHSLSQQGLTPESLGGVAVYTNPDGSRILANEEGEIIGTLDSGGANAEANGQWVELQLHGQQPVYIGPEGQSDIVRDYLSAPAPTAIGASFLGPQIPRGRDPIVFVSLQPSTHSNPPILQPHLQRVTDVPKATNSTNGRIGRFSICIKWLQESAFELRSPASDSSLVTRSAGRCVLPN